MNDYYTQSSEMMTPIASPKRQVAQPTQVHPSMIQDIENKIKYNVDAFSTDLKDVMKRGLKYLFEGLAVAFVAYYFTKGKLDTKEIIMLGITAAFVFAILDTFSPTVSMGARFGAGFGIGQSVFGVAPGMMAAPMMAMK